MRLVKFSCREELIMKKSVLALTLLVMASVAIAAPAKRNEFKRNEKASIGNVKIQTIGGDGPFYWQGANGTTYSDTPRNHTGEGVNILNVRTHTSTAMQQQTAGGEIIDPNEKKLTLAEKQAQLALEIAEDNKRKEAENKRREEEMKKSNCQMARMNLQNAQSANRMENREEAIARYQADISKYCN